MKKLSVIIPCWNEKETIREIISQVEAVKIVGWEIQIIIVDDYSTDTTREILKDYEHKHTVIYHDKNAGKGSAVKTGLAHAQGDYILIQDADLEYNPREIKNLITALGTPEENKNNRRVVYGSRNIHHVARKGFLIPRIGVWFITVEFNIFFHTHLTDLWTCYKLFPIEASLYFDAGHFESELSFSARLITHGFTIIETPISHNPRMFGAGKKIRYKDGVQGIFTLIQERFFQRK